MRFPKPDLENNNDRSINYSETGLLYREIDLMFEKEDVNRELLLSELYKSKEIVQFNKPELGCYIEENYGISALSNRKYLKQNWSNILKILIFFGTISSIILYSANIYNISNKNSTNSNYTVNVVNFSDNIRSLLKAEDNRDFEKIKTFYADEIYKYWNSNNINIDELKTQYENTWNISLNPKNKILSINQIDNYNYVLKTKFEYYHIKKEKYKSIKSDVRYVFNKKGKIIEVYENQ